MTHDDETSTERITNLESLLDNFQRDKEISESNDKEYSQKTKKNQQPYVKNANLSEIKLRQDMKFIRDKIKTRYDPKKQRTKRKAMNGTK